MMEGRLGRGLRGCLDALRLNPTEEGARAYRRIVGALRLAGKLLSVGRFGVIAVGAIGGVAELAFGDVGIASAGELAQCGADERSLDLSGLTSDSWNCWAGKSRVLYVGANAELNPGAKVVVDLGEYCRGDRGCSQDIIDTNPGGEVSADGGQLAMKIGPDGIALLQLRPVGDESAIRFNPGPPALSADNERGGDGRYWPLVGYVGMSAGVYALLRLAVVRRRRMDPFVANRSQREAFGDFVAESEEGEIAKVESERRLNDARKEIQERQRRPRFRRPIVIRSLPDEPDPIAAAIDAGRQLQDDWEGERKKILSRGERFDSKPRRVIDRRLSWLDFRGRLADARRENKN